MSADEIVSAVCELCGINKGALLSRRQGEGLPRTRQLCAVLMTDKLNMTHAAIAEALQRKHGSAIGHELKVARRLLAEDDVFRALYARAVERLTQKVAA